MRMRATTIKWNVFVISRLGKNFEVLDMPILALVLFHLFHPYNPVPRTFLFLTIVATHSHT